MSVPGTALHVLKGPRVPETPGHTFLCEHFRGTLMGGECLRRQTTRRKAGANAKDQSPKVPRHLEYCAGGQCAQGKEIAAKFPDWTPEERTRPQGNWASYVKTPSPHEELTRPARDPLPPAIAEDLAEDLAAAAQQAERDRVAAAVEEVRPEVAQRAPAVATRWERFRERKEKQRAEEPAEEKPLREPHPLSRRAMAEPKEEEPMEFAKCSTHGCKQQISLAHNKSGKCRWCKNSIPLDSPSHGVKPPSQQPKGKAPQSNGARARQVARRKLNRNGDPTQPRAAAPAAQTRNGAPAASSDNIEDLLEQRRAHHLAEAERIGRALAALRGAA